MSHFLPGKCLHAFITAALVSMVVSACQPPLPSVTPGPDITPLVENTPISPPSSVSTQVSPSPTPSLAFPSTPAPAPELMLIPVPDIDLYGEAVHLVAGLGRVWLATSGAHLWVMDTATGEWLTRIDLMQNEPPLEDPLKPGQMFFAAGNLWLTLRGFNFEQAVAVNPETYQIIIRHDLTGYAFDSGLVVGERVLFAPNVYSARSGFKLYDHEKMGTCYTPAPIGAVKDIWAAFRSQTYGLVLVNTDYPNWCRYSLLPEPSRPDFIAFAGQTAWRIHRASEQPGLVLSAYWLEDLLNNAYDPLRADSGPTSQPYLQENLDGTGPPIGFPVSLFTRGTGLWLVEKGSLDPLVTLHQIDSTTASLITSWSVPLPDGSSGEGSDGMPAGIGQPGSFDGRDLWLPLGQSLGRIMLP